MKKNFSLSVPNSPHAMPLGPAVKSGDDPPMRRYIKPVLRIGQFVHPREGWTLDVNDRRLEGHIATFKRMQLAGIPAKLTKNHKRDADSVVGDVTDFMRGSIVDQKFQPDAAGEWLGAVVEVRGEKNIELVEANKDVSVEIDKKFIGPDQTRYPENIRFVSIVPNPLIPGQSGFERLAASDGDDDDDDRPTYLFSDGEPVMKKLFSAVAAVAALAGMCLSADAVTEDSGVEALNRVKVKLESLETDKSELTRKLSDATEEHQPDTKYLSLAGRAMEKEIDGLKGVISDAGVAALKKELVGDLSKKEFSTFLLSADSEEDGLAAVERLVKIIREHPAVKKGSQTGQQETKKLSVDDSHAEDDGEASPAVVAARKLADAHIASTYGIKAEMATK